jgi:hypothetical protein
MIGAGTRIRTTDFLITNEALYQLSYTGVGGQRREYSVALIECQAFLSRTLIRTSTLSCSVPSGRSGRLMMLTWSAGMSDS